MKLNCDLCHQEIKGRPYPAEPRRHFCSVIHRQIWQTSAANPNRRKPEDSGQLSAPGVIGAFNE